MFTKLFILAVGATLLFLGVVHELRWRRRSRNFEINDGRVIGIHIDDDESCFPEIEYMFDGKLKRFRSCYSFGPRPDIGTRVRIMVNAEDGDAELFTPNSRWTFTVVPILVGILSIGIALVT